MPEENLPSPQKPELQPTKSYPIEVMPVRQMKILFSWKAPIRPFKKRDKDFWTTVLAIIFLLSLILFFVKEWFLIAAIISLAFVYYILSSVPPEEVEYRITNKGIILGENSYDWDLLWRFWFSDKYAQRLLNIDTKLSMPGRLSFVIRREDEQNIKEILEKYLLNEESPPTFFDKASAWLAKKLPLELEKKEPVGQSPPVPTSPQP